MIVLIHARRKQPTRYLGCTMFILHGQLLRSVPMNRCIITWHLVKDKKIFHSFHVTREAPGLSCRFFVIFMAKSFAVLQETLNVVLSLLRIVRLGKAHVIHPFQFIQSGNNASTFSGFDGREVMTRCFSRTMDSNDYNAPFPCFHYERISN